MEQIQATKPRCGQWLLRSWAEINLGVLRALSVLLRSNRCRTRSENHGEGLLVWVLSSTLWGLLLPPKNPFWFPLGCSSHRVTRRGSRGDCAGRVHLDTCVGNCPALLLRSKETPDGMSVWFSGKALHEWDSSDSPIHHNSQLLPLQFIRDMVYEKPLGDYLFFFSSAYVSGVAWSKLCVCWWHVKQYLPGNFRNIL